MFREWYVFILPKKGKEKWNTRGEMKLQDIDVNVLTKINQETH